jgi:2'-5' RNA ligase
VSAAGESTALILTAGLDEDAFAYLDGLRRRHFPPERNVLRAHLTLFHALPGEEEDAIRAELARATAERAPIDARAADVIGLGRGVAVRIDAPELVELRAALAAGWHAWLTPQDRQKLRPHVTVQNKVAPAVARALHAELAAGFEPFPVRIDRLCLWRYLGGPWEARAAFAFRVREHPA